MSRQTIHLALGTDDGYACHCATTIASAVISSPSTRIHIHILANQLSAHQRELLCHTAQSLGAQLSIYDLDPQLYSGIALPRDQRISISTYSRCFITEILPHSLSRVLYLDCDLIVRHDLGELWHHDLTDRSTAMVRDYGIADATHLGFEPSEPYFNAGVLLINLDYWRQHGIGTLCRRYLQTHAQQLRYADQDVLNAVLRGSVRYISLQWNMLEVYYSHWYYEASAPHHATIKALRPRPYIVHFTARHKPWLVRCGHPYTDAYYYYRARTASPPLGLRHYMRHYLYILSTYLGLSKRHFVSRLSLYLARLRTTSPTL